MTTLDPRVANPPLQSYQFKLLIFLGLCVCAEIWLKTLLFGQSCYRKFSGISGCEANLTVDGRVTLAIGEEGTDKHMTSPAGSPLATRQNALTSVAPSL